MPNNNTPLSRREQDSLIIDYALDDSYSFPKEKPLGASGIFLKIKQQFSNCFEIEEAFGTRFLFSALFVVVGALFYFFSKTFIGWEEGLLLLCFCLISMYAIDNWRLFYLFFYFLACISVGFLAANFEDWRYSTPMLSSEQITNLTGQIYAIEKREGNSCSLLIKVLHTENPPLKEPVKFVKAFIRKAPKKISLGDKICGVISLKPFSGPVYPNGYDYAFQNYFKNIGAQGFFYSVPKISKDDSPLNWKVKTSFFITNIRNTIAARIKAILPGEEGNLASALIIGERAGIDENVQQDLRISGLAHILAISGLHMAMISFMVLIVIRKALTLLFWWYPCYPIKKIASFFALIAAASYLFLSGMGISAQRSFIMVAVMLLSIIFDRSAVTMRNLAIAAFLIVLWSPHQILNPSFQMSFSATAALVSVYGWWTINKDKYEKYTRIPVFLGSSVLEKLGKPLISIVASSLIAGTASGIFAAYHFSNVALLGVLGNLLALPILSFWVMPAALLSVFMMFFHLETIPLQLMGMGISFIEGIAHFVTELSPIIAPVKFSLDALAVLSLGLATLLFMRTSLRWFGLIIVFTGFFMVCRTQKPLALIYENSRYAIAFNKDGSAAINERRMSKYLINSIKPAFAIDKILLPNNNIKKTFLEDGEGSFFCTQAQCKKRLSNGQRLIIFKMPEARKNYVKQINDILILDYPNNKKLIDLHIKKTISKSGCEKRKEMIFTKEEFLLYGSMLIYPNNVICWSVNNPTKSWNNYRYLSKM